MKHQISGILLVMVILSLAMLPQVHSPASSSQPRTSVQPQPSMYYNPPSPLNGSITASGFDLDPAALVTSDGNLWIAWESNRAGSYQIYYQIYNGILWTLPTVVSSAAFNSAPSLAQMNNGTVILVWAGGTNGTNNHLYYRTNTNGIWKGAVSLTSGTGFTDELPKAIVTRDSTLWVFFERDTSTGPSTPPNRQIYYKTLRGNNWSSDTVFTTGSAMNQQPAATVIRNGNIWVAWARNATGGNNIIYYRSFNGTQWSGDTALTSPGVTSSPSLVQDRNGTMWLYWSQNLAVSGNVTQNQILYKSSTNVGQSWSAATNLTRWGDVNNPINNITPFAVQGSDTTLSVFFSTDVVEPLGYGFHIYYIQSSPIYPVYAVGISSVQVSPTMNYPYGDNPTNIATITVTVQNYGDQNQAITVNLQASNTTKYSLTPQTGTVLASLSSVFTFKWNVTGITPARYTLAISIPPVSGETPGNIIGNSITVKSAVAVTLAGDILRLGRVNINDMAIMGHCWLATPSSPNWNPDCDILRKGVVNINDEAVAGANWLKSI
jgi:hypothetical protein